MGSWPLGSSLALGPFSGPAWTPPTCISENWCWLFTGLSLVSSQKAFHFPCSNREDRASPFSQLSLFLLQGFCWCTRTFSRNNLHTWAITVFSYCVWVLLTFIFSCLLLGFCLFGCFLWKGGASFYYTGFMSLRIWKGRCCGVFHPQILSNPFRCLAYAWRVLIIHSFNRWSLWAYCVPGWTLKAGLQYRARVQLSWSLLITSKCLNQSFLTLHQSVFTEYNFNTSYLRLYTQFA